MSSYFDKKKTASRSLTLVTVKSMFKTDCFLSLKPYSWGTFLFTLYSIMLMAIPRRLVCTSQLHSRYSYISLTASDPKLARSCTTATRLNKHIYIFLWWCENRSYLAYFFMNEPAGKIDINITAISYYTIWWAVNLVIQNVRHRNMRQTSST